MKRLYALIKFLDVLVLTDVDGTDRVRMNFKFSELDGPVRMLEGPIDTVLDSALKLLDQTLPDKRREELRKLLEDEPD